MKIIMTIMTVFLCVFSGFGRDIDLDSVYIKKNSFYYKKLVQKKIELYEKSGSRFVDSDVIFAHWLSGFKIVYIRETGSINKIMVYDRLRRSKRFIVAVEGVITTSRYLYNRKQLILKTLSVVGRRPKGEMVLVDIRNKKIKKIRRRFSFQDFSILPGSTSLLVNNNKGIIEYDPVINSKELVFPNSVFADIRKNGSPTIAFMSPNRKNALIINGSGGTYRAKLLIDSRSRRFRGISSVSEVFWVNNRSFVFRKGSPGYFSVRLHDVSSNKTKVLLRSSYNTNICYSRFPKIISFLKEQMVFLYFLRKNQVFKTGLEGEDVYFNPGGSWFSSLFHKKLFITNVYALKKRKHLFKSTFKGIHFYYQQLAKARADWNNNYSREYIRRKTILYKSML